MKSRDFILGWAASEVFSSWKAKRKSARQLESLGEKIQLNQNSCHNRIELNRNRDPWGSDWDPFIIDEAYSSSYLCEVYKEPDFGSFLAKYIGFFRQSIAEKIANETELTEQEIASDLTFNLYICTIVYMSICSAMSSMIVSSFDRKRIFGRANNLIIARFEVDGLVDSGIECAKLMEEMQSRFGSVVPDIEMVNMFSEDSEIISIYRENLVVFLSEFYDVKFSGYVADKVIPKCWVFKENLLKAILSVFPDAAIHKYFQESGLRE